MPSGLILYLIDTNIFIYWLKGENQIKAERARVVLEGIVSNRSGSVSTQVLNELLSNLTRDERSQLDFEWIEDIMNSIIAEYRVFDTTVDTIKEAINGVRRYQLAYWDSLIWAAAKLNNVPYVLSEDFTHGQTLDGVTFLNPLREDFVLTPN